MPSLFIPLIQPDNYQTLLEECAARGVRIEVLGADAINLYCEALKRADDFTFEQLFDNLLARRRDGLPEVLED